MKTIYFKNNGQIEAKQLPFTATFTDLNDLIYEYMKENPGAEEIRPIEIIITPNNTLSGQCIRITGDSFNLNDFDSFNNGNLIRHIKTDIYIQSYSIDKIRLELLNMEELMNEVSQLLEHINKTHRYSMSDITNLHNKVFGLNQQPTAAASDIKLNNLGAVKLVEPLYKQPEMELNQQYKVDETKDLLLIAREIKRQLIEDNEGRRDIIATYKYNDIRVIQTESTDISKLIYEYTAAKTIGDKRFSVIGDNIFW